MEIPKDLSAETLTFMKEKNILNDIAQQAQQAQQAKDGPRLDLNKDKNILSDIAQETKDAPGYGSLTADELMEKVENILLEKIRAGEKQAYFQLGLFYYEQVWMFFSYLLFMNRS